MSVSLRRVSTRMTQFNECSARFVRHHSKMMQVAACIALLTSAHMLSLHFTSLEKGGCELATALSWKGAFYGKGCGNETPSTLVDCCGVPLPPAHFLEWKESFNDPAMEIQLQFDDLPKPWGWGVDPFGRFYSAFKLRCEAIKNGTACCAQGVATLFQKYSDRSILALGTKFFPERCKVWGKYFERLHGSEFMAKIRGLVVQARPDDGPDVAYFHPNESPP